MMIDGEICSKPKELPLIDCQPLYTCPCPQDARCRALQPSALSERRSLETLISVEIRAVETCGQRVKKTSPHDDIMTMIARSISAAKWHVSSIRTPTTV